MCPHPWGQQKGPSASLGHRSLDSPRTCPRPQMYVTHYSLGAGGGVAGPCGKGQVGRTGQPWQPAALLSRGRPGREGRVPQPFFNLGLQQTWGAGTQALQSGQQGGVHLKFSVVPAPRSGAPMPRWVLGGHMPRTHPRPLWAEGPRSRACQLWLLWGISLALESAPSCLSRDALSSVALSLPHPAPTNWTTWAKRESRAARLSPGQGKGLLRAPGCGQRRASARRAQAWGQPPPLLRLGFPICSMGPGAAPATGS